MKSNRFQLVMLALWVLTLAAGSGGVQPAAAQAGDPPAGPDAAQANLGGGFTYQGQLNSGGTPLTGTCDMQFTLWSALAGPAVASATQTVTGISVAAGKFAIVLNDAAQFGAYPFKGSAHWLEIAVRCPAGAGGYSTLTPRQPLTAAPYALSLRSPAVMESTLGVALLSAHNLGGGPALLGNSDNGAGVWGQSIGSGGVFGLSEVGSGVEGQSTDSFGVKGASENGYGVYGFSDTNHGVTGATADTSGDSAGVAAFGAGSSTQSISLKLANGGIQIAGAGVNTATPVFIHKVIMGGGGNVCPAHTWASVINYPLINGNPNAILIVTPNNGPYNGGVTPLNSIPAVFYDNADFCGVGPDKWVIYTLDQSAALPNNAMYNVLAIVP